LFDISNFAISQRIHIYYRVIAAIYIQVLRQRVGQLAGVGIFAQEPPHARIIVSRPQVNKVRLVIMLLPGVAGGVVQNIFVLAGQFSSCKGQTKGFVVIFCPLVSGGGDQLADAAKAVVEVVQRVLAFGTAVV